MEKSQLKMIVEHKGLPSSLGKTIQEGLQIIFLLKSSFQIGMFLFKLGVLS